MTRWVPRAWGVLVLLVASAAGAPAAAVTPATPATSAPATGLTADGEPRPLGDLVTTLLRLVGATSEASGCEGVDWRHGLSVRLEPCQATPGADAVGLTSGDGPRRGPGSRAGSGSGSGSRPGSRSTDGSAPVASADRTTPLKSQGDGNLAGGRPTSASSAVEGSPPSHAVDDTVDTAWRARGGAWWQVDLGRATGISTVIVNWDAHALPAGYTLQLSKDGARWARAGKSHGRPNGGPTVLELSRPDLARGRFVRVQAKGPVDGNAGVALRDVRVFGSASSAARRGESLDPAAGALLPGTSAFTGLPDLGDGGLVPTSDPGVVQAGASTGFGGPDPLTTAAMLVIVLVGVTGLVIGQTAGGGRHRQRGLAAVRLVVQRLRDMERMPRPGSPRTAGTPGTPGTP